MSRPVVHAIKSSQYSNFRGNFWRLSYLSNTYLGSKNMFQLALNIVFVFSTTANLFEAEIGVNEIRQVSKLWPLGKSAASFCHQAAAWVPDMFWNFYLMKNYKIANISATTWVREKISTYLESLKIDVYLTKFKNNKILLNKISHQCLLTT